MKQDIDILKRLFQERLPAWEKNLRKESSQKANTGSPLSESLVEDAYILAVGGLLFCDDLGEYVAKVNVILQVFFRLHSRFQKGEIVYLVSNWPRHHEFIFFALCINDLKVAKAFAELCDTEKLKPASKHHKFNVTFTQSLKNVILDNRTEAEIWSDKFYKQCQAQDSKAYEGYALALKCISARNCEGFLDALGLIVASFSRQTGADGFFHAAEKARFSHYGIGLVHLARSKNMNVEFEHPLIPLVLTSLPEHVYEPPLPKKFFSSFGKYLWFGAK